MSDTMRAGWDAAVAACLNGHSNDETECTFGGPTPGTGYWLAAVDCDLNHGSTCAWCPAEATTGFAGWADDGWSMWQVPACEEHGAAWAAGHLEWTRERPESPGKTGAEVLAEWRALLSPGDAMDDALLYGVGGHTPDQPNFTGILGFLADGGEQR